MTANATTFKSYIGVLFEEINPKATNKWINHIGIYHRTRTRPGLQWCPLCLRTDEVPYYRRRWRLGISSTCLKHGIILSCRCQDCGKPAVPHRSIYHQCHHCGMSRLSGNSHVADSQALQFEGMLNSGLLGDPVSIEAGKSMHPIIFYRNIYFIYSFLAFGPRSRSLRRAVSNSYGQVFGWPSISTNVVNFGALSSENRHALAGLTARLIEGWPWRFIGLCLDARFYWSWITKDNDRNEIPYDVLRIGDKYLRGN